MKNLVNFILKFLQYYCTLYIVTILVILDSRLFVFLNNTVTSVLVTLTSVLLHSNYKIILLVVSISFVLINLTLLNGVHLSLYLLISVHYIIESYSGEAVISHTGGSSTCKYCFTLYAHINVEIKLRN